MSFANHSTYPIAIIGGGLGGLALAVGLVKRGIHVHIYESASVFSEIGAGVTSGVNAVRALQLIDEKLLEGYKRHATFNKDENMSDVFLNVRWGCDEKPSGNGNAAKAGDFMFDVRDIWHPELARELGVKTRSSIHRARLLEELVALLPPDITTFSKNFDTAEELSDGTLKLYFSDGTSALASAIIGADGIKSRVRELVCGADVRARYARECAYRAVIPRQDAIHALGDDGALNGHIYCGYGGYIITYPIEFGDLINVVLMPHDLDHIDKDGNMKSAEANGENRDQDEWTVSIDRKEMVDRFEGWYKPLIDVAAKFLMPSKWLLHDLKHDTPYFKGRMCLLGDSAHATTPHLGAGAGQAMEDAYILSDLIASTMGIEHLDRAFEAYDRIRRPRTQGVVERSLQAAHGYAFLLEGVGDDHVKMKERLEESYQWIWHDDLDKQLHSAKGLLS